MDSNNKIIFVILPYRDDNTEVTEQRVALAEKYCAKLMMRGFFPVCTTSFGHYLVKRHDVPKSWAYWKDYCKAMIQISKEVHLLKLDGWDTSEGVTEERKLIADAERKLIEIEPEDI